MRQLHNHYIIYSVQESGHSTDEVSGHSALADVKLPFMYTGPFFDHHNPQFTIDRTHLVCLILLNVIEYH